MSEFCKAEHPGKPGVTCVFGLGHPTNYHFGGSNDSNGNMGYRWPVTDAEDTARLAVAAALGLAQGDKPYPELFKHWITTVYASGMPNVPYEFTRADMAKAFDAGAARYNDLLQSWSECRGELQKERNLGDTLRSALKEEAQRSESYLAAYRSATDDLRVAHKVQPMRHVCKGAECESWALARYHNPNGTPEQHSYFNDGWHAAKEPTLDERVRAFYARIMEAPEACCPSINFMHDDKDAFPDGYWELRRFNAIDINAPDTVWRGLTLHDALARAELEEGAR